MADYAEAIRLNPKYANALNNRAYLLATTLQDQYRNGARAVQDALQACELTGWNDAGYLDTLAVAYAEVGDFKEAIRWQEKSLENRDYAQSSGEQARKQIELFKQGKPYRE